MPKRKGARGFKSKEAKRKYEAFKHMHICKGKGRKKR
jgi:hypothetical protein